MIVIENETKGIKLTFDPTKLLDFFMRLSCGLNITEEELEEATASIVSELPSYVQVKDLLRLCSESLAQKIVLNPEYSILAGRVEVFAIRRFVPSKFSVNFKKLRDNVQSKTGEPHPLVCEEACNFVLKHSDFLDSLVVPERDNDITFFGMRTLAKSYLLQAGCQVSETPQYLFLRVAVGIHALSNAEPTYKILDKIAQTYNLMSQKYFIHASPTLFNAATPGNFLSLCFLMALEDDSIDGIFKSLHKTALISKASGGIGIHVNNIRSTGSLIKSSNGTSNGLVPMLRVFNSTARYVDQGGNKRPGAIAIYMEPWHGDIEDFLNLRKNHGLEEQRARDLFYALWIPDLFMRRVENNEDWSLFSPNEAKDLSDNFGNEFDKLYIDYEKKGLAIKTFKARKLWIKILEAQTETGMPFMLYKDACNQKLNQKNLGTIKSSNLCCEVVQYSSKSETAVCNLALIGLPSFVSKLKDSHFFDFSKLHEITKCVARNLDQVIDSTAYPTDCSKYSNLKHRPIAIGVQGLGDVFMLLRIPFESKEAKRLNIQIFETIYHGAVESSMEMAVEKGPYESFSGSPASEGILQFDLWNHKPDFFEDWDELKEKVKTYGLRNSLLVGPMPTASTSQILGFNECFEPFTSNIYLRRVLSGEFQIVNKYLIQDLIALGLWNNAIKEQIIINDGLIQKIEVIPDELKKLYKTVWEISQKTLVEMAVDRGKFIDQLQSLNIHIEKPSFKSLTSCHFYGWKNGLKTGMYYLRTKAASKAIQFSVDHKLSALEISAMKKPEMGSFKQKSYLEVLTFKRKPNTIIDDIASRKRSQYSKSKVDSPFFSLAFLSPVSDEQDSKSQSPELETPSKVTTPEEVFDIFDGTPITCNITNVEGCESCSA